MQLIDRHARDNLGQYLKQCLMATLIIVAILFFLDVAKYSVVIASLGATSFIVFAIPHSYSASVVRISGGYAVGILVGAALHYAEKFILSLDMIQPPALGVAIGGLAVGISILIMVAANLEHPPAAGLSIGLVFNQWTAEGLIVIFSAIGTLCLSKYLLRKWLINLHAPVEN